jgi:hypothetical protein
MKSLLLALAAMFALALPSYAQATAHPTAGSYVAGPWQRDAVAGIQARTASVDYSRRAAYEGGAHKGQPIALMAVGGAAILLGAVADNDAGALLMVGGSVVGLYGLYLYLR